MFLDFSDRKFKGLLTHQGRVLADYQNSGVDKADVALKLPTGSGKTLVGALIADWRRRKFEERVVYVCPTKQLVNQVVEEAHSKYGMSESVYGFTGMQRDYNPAAKAKYYSGEIIAVTTYGGLFNANTVFDEPNLIVFDDAHSAENYMIGHWTLSIQRSDHPTLFQALAGILQQVMSAHDARRLTTTAQTLWDYTWVDLIPSEHVAQVQDQLAAVLDEHVGDSKLRYPWAVLRDHLTACQMYVSANEISIRPLLPPTQRYGPFRQAGQRLYMSATLGEGGDLERLTGIPRIHRLSVPDDFSAQGVGRRFFIFPGRSLSEDEQASLQNRAIERAERAVVLVPDFRSAGQVEEQIKEALNHNIYGASQIEDSKDAFVDDERAVAILANRYDGIDFPDEQCRLLIMRGLPAAANLQERFLTSKMSARLLLADRIRTRVVQAVGRCTRSPTDYSAVMVMGENLLTYLSKTETRAFLHPELQAEIKFGLDQSGSADEMLENLDLFYARGDEWRAADNEIRRLRGEATQTVLPALSELSAAAEHEVKFQYARWDGNFQGALASARAVLGELKDPALQGYRALWNYLAGTAAAELAREGVPGQEGVAREYFALAARAATGIPWLRRIAGLGDLDVAAAKPGATAAPLIERLESVLDNLGTLHDQKYTAFEKEILQGIMQNDAPPFEAAHEKLGTLLGFESGNVETSGAPDPWWLVHPKLCFVFEDYTGAQPTSTLSVAKARQVALHPNWIRDHLGLDADATVIPVLVSTIQTADDAAAVHLQEVTYWPLEQFRAWAINAVQTVRQLRVTYPGAGDLYWRDEALAAYAANGIDPASLIQRLQPLKGSAILTS
jgi:hypothetical protein